jgi:hypothetical protein
MTFLTKTNHPVLFISTDVLVLSKRLMYRKIKHYKDEIRESTDMEFITGRREKIRALNLIVADLRELISTLGS